MITNNNGTGCSDVSPPEGELFANGEVFPENLKEINKEIMTEENKNKGSNARDLALKIAQEQELFHGSDKVAYVTVDDKDSLITFKVDSEEFRGWLHGQLYIRYKVAATSRMLNEQVIPLLVAQAMHDNGEKDAFTRVAGSKDEVYIDTGNPGQNSVVHITSAGWEMQDNREKRTPFLRASGFLALKLPVKEKADLKLLRNIVNCGDDDQWKLIVAWAVNSCLSYGPYPVLVLEGEQGTGKSTTSTTLTSLIDPSRAAIRMAPRKIDDIVIAAQNSRLLSYDNLSGIKPEMSDVLCGIATGTAHTTRTLFTNSGEEIFSVERPIMLNGIDAIATRGDLASRAVILRLPVIPPNKRQEKAALTNALEIHTPAILGGLYNAVAAVLKELPDVKLEEAPRMKTYAMVGTALEKHMGWKKGSFMDAYRSNIQNMALSEAENNPLIGAIVHLLGTDGEFSGTPSQLFKVLNEYATSNDYVKRSCDWPRDAASLSRALNRIAPIMREAGIEYGKLKRTSKSRGIYLCYAKDAVLPDDMNDASDIRSAVLPVLAAPQGNDMTLEDCPF